MDIHGGNVYDHKVSLDFSTNINPYGPPPSVRRFIEDGEFKEFFLRYPRVYPNALEEKISDVLGVERERIIVGPGSSFLIYLFISLFSGRRFLIPAPTFSEYERAALSYGCSVKFLKLREDMGFRICLGELVAASHDVDVIALCNPNNPTGKYMDPDELDALFRWSGERGINIILDEAFIDFVEAKKPYFYPDHVIVIRSFTKSYGIPGVRLGYAFSGKDVIKAARVRIPPWSLSGGAEEIGILCLDEGKFLEESVERLRKNKDFLKEKLSEAGLKVFASLCNFLLIKSERDLFSYLLGKGILIRDCSNFRGLENGFYRIAVRRLEECETLVNALK